LLFVPEEAGFWIRAGEPLILHLLPGDPDRHGIRRAFCGVESFAWRHVRDGAVGTECSLCSHEEAAMYVVTAVDQRPGPPAISQARDYRVLPATPEPVGIQHAVPRILGAEGPRQALCGADVAGWVVFRDRPFVTSSGATCQRCAQLAASTAQEG
jgi:hypothetical protein